MWQSNAVMTSIKCRNDEFFHQAMYGSLLLKPFCKAYDYVICLPGKIRRFNWCESKSDG
jgi:hypothetical protein